MSISKCGDQEPQILNQCTFDFLIIRITFDAEEKAYAPRSKAFVHLKLIPVPKASLCSDLNLLLATTA
ncbi:uncharacterized protein CCR75_002399 [Bremia lactucae]|uniref:Uncharacterized protein n=1 Tax=Bremia lactucae TaxID=4779 RepID=A0A976FQF1_BRELC|nr:hypothetical protein CCR75_006645 [Bremia lactucae]TDH73370.1 hypothetical protein CCR75_002399 [Bremia lactucae]